MLKYQNRENNGESNGVMKMKIMASAEGNINGEMAASMARQYRRRISVKWRGVSAAGGMIAVIGVAKKSSKRQWLWRKRLAQ
jgi:hypothetical protein